MDDALGQDPAQRGDTFERLMSVLREPVVIASCVRDDSGTIQDFTYMFLNEQAAEIIQRPVADVIGGRMTAVLPNGGSLYFESYCHVVETGEAIEVVLPAVDVGGQRRAWEVSVTKLGDGFAAVGHDVTARTIDTQRLQDRERLYRILADYAAEVAGLSVQGVIVWVAPSITNLLGWSVDEFVGHTIASYIHPDDLPGVMRFQQQLDHVGRQRVRFRMRHKDGGWRWIESSSRRTSDEDGGLDNTVVSMLWDVQSEVDALDALQRAEAERVEMEARVQQAERLDSLGVLAGGVAHDFNNLLMGVMGNAELALLRIDDPVTRRLLDQIVQATQRAADLTRQMLDYAGQRSLEAQPVSLARVVDETMQLVRSTISRWAAVTVAVPADLPPIVGDPGQLRQVLLNLALNASEALDGAFGHITIRASIRDVDEVEAARLSPAAPLAAGRFVVLDVSDTGRGMSPDTMHRMFEPFFTTKPTGKGLGLSVVHGVVRSLGGATEVISDVGVGTTIRALLPAGEHPAEPTEPTEPTAGASPGRLVLVIDDDHLVLDVIAEALRASGYEVVAASNPNVAIGAFVARPNDFAMALIDVTMPEMSGPEALAALRDHRPELPGVMMSGYSRSDITMTETAAHTAFLQKPFGIDMLLDTVAAAFNVAVADER